MDRLLELLFCFSDVLFVPVMVGLGLLVLHALVSVGAFLREAIGRRAALARAVERMHELAPSGRGQAIERLELDWARVVDRDAALARLGPMLGLAGTLIPLGPGLRQLHQGDLGGFGQQLAVAFATTVSGLFVCAVCFVISGVRSQWYERDLRALARQFTSGDAHG